MVLQTNHNVFRFEISVNDLAHSMHVVQTDQTLSSQSSCKRHRHSLVVIALDDLKEVYAQDFEHHNEVLAVWTVVNERIEELDAVRSVSTHSNLAQGLLKFSILRVKFID